MSFVSQIVFSADRPHRPIARLMAMLVLTVLGSVVGEKTVYGEGQRIPLPMVPISSTNAAQVKLLATVGHGYPQGMVWSPDGQQLAVSSTAGVWLYAANAFATEPRQLPNIHGLIVYSPDSQTFAANGKIWSLPAVTPIATLDHADTTDSFQAAFTADGRTLAFKTVDGGAAIWDVVSGKIRGVLGTGGSSAETQLTALSITPDGQWLALARYSGDVELWSVANYRKIATLTGQYHGRSPLVFSPDGTLLALVSDKYVQWWPIPNSAHAGATMSISGAGQTFPRLKGSTSIAFSADSRFFAANDISGNIVLIDTASGSIQAALPLNSSYAPFALSPDGQQVAVNLNGVSVWNFKTSTQTGLSGFGYFQKAAFAVADGPTQPTRAVIFSDGLPSIEKVLRWTLASNNVSPLFDSSVGGTFKGLSPDGKLLVIERASNRIDLFDTTSGLPVTTLQTDKNTIAEVRFSANSQVLAVTTEANHVLLWNIGSGHDQSAIKPLFGFDALATFALSADGTYAAFLTGEAGDKTGKKITLFDTTSGQPLFTLSQPYDGARLPNNQTVSLIASRNANSIDFAPVPAPFTHILNGMVFTPDSRTLLIGSGTEISAVDMHSHLGTTVRQGSSGGIMLSPDGITLIFSDGHKALNLLTNQWFALDLPVNFDLNASAFSPDGSLLAYESCLVPDGPLSIPSVADGKDGQIRPPQIETGLLAMATGKRIAVINQRAKWPDSGCMANTNAAMVPATVAFNADGSLLLTLGDDKILNLWGIPPTTN